jgi:hypothetical protein
MERQQRHRLPKGTGGNSRWEAALEGQGRSTWGAWVGRSHDQRGYAAQAAQGAREARIISTFRRLRQEDNKVQGQFGLHSETLSQKQTNKTTATGQRERGREKEQERERILNVATQWMNLEDICWVEGSHYKMKNILWSHLNSTHSSHSHTDRKYKDCLQGLAAVLRFTKKYKVLMPLNCTLKMVTIVQLMLCISYHN